ncbi:hypothetical protein [Actinopolymorpha cephalotaxi]|uniref:hypothetical protein n=1 Tax=Actinopolymorpha cephalotaxi TaxID=504797 RepID=UPI0036347377
MAVVDSGGSGLEPVLDVGLAHPVTQTRLRDPEIGSDLLDRLPRLTPTGNVD